MAAGYGEKEQEFIDGLKEATGRDLAEWMAAISVQKLTERNDIIYWLRRQGFMFAKASWMERIHHNGGKPIYAGGSSSRPPIRAPRGPRTPRQARKEPAAGAQAVPETAGAGKPEEVASAAAPSPAPVPASSPQASELEPLLAKAKAYRPLAQHLITQIKSVRPSAGFLARETFLAIADPQEFARLGIGAKELRLHLALGEHGFDDVVRKAVPGGGLGKDDALTHMVVLTDARQVDRRLLDLVARAAAHVNG